MKLMFLALVVLVCGVCGCIQVSPNYVYTNVDHVVLDLDNNVEKKQECPVCEKCQVCEKCYQKTLLNITTYNYTNWWTPNNITYDPFISTIPNTNLIPVAIREAQNAR